MIRHKRVTFILFLSLSLSVFATSAIAETPHAEEMEGYQRVPAGMEEGQQGNLSAPATSQPQKKQVGPVNLPWEAINWTDFSFKEEKDVQALKRLGGHEPGPPMIAYFVNFLILVALIVGLARKPMIAFLQSRSEAFSDKLNEAKVLLEQADTKLADYSARLERMDEEMNRLREEFIADGEAERDRIIEEAGARAERMKHDTEVRLQQEFSQLKEELRVEVIEKAVATATEKLVKEVKDGDRRRLEEEYLGQLEQEGLGR